MTKTETSAKSAQVATAKASVKSGKVMTAAELSTPAQAAEKTKTARQQAAQDKQSWKNNLTSLPTLPQVSDISIAFAKARTRIAIGGIFMTSTKILSIAAVFGNQVTNNRFF